MRPPRTSHPRPTLRSRGTRRRAALVTAGAALVALGGASSAQAASTQTAGCAATSVSTIFASLGDLANYSLAPGGNFEGGTSGWTLGGASVVAGNETTSIANKKDTKSLAVPAKSVVVSPSFCVGIEHPMFRLTARQTSGSWAAMLVKVRWKGSDGKTNDTTVAGLNGANFLKWTATPTLMLAQALPLWAAGQSVTAQIVLDPEDSGGAWQVDDLYIDPYRRS